MAKYLAQSGGTIYEYEAITGSTGSSDSDKIVQTKNNGLIDNSFLELSSSDINNFDNAVSNNNDVSGNTLARHDAVTLFDDSLSITGQTLQVKIDQTSGGGDNTLILTNGEGLYVPPTIFNSIAASGVTYDNTESTLTGDTVQSVIDELDVNKQNKLIIQNGLTKTGDTLVFGGDLNENTVVNGNFLYSLFLRNFTDWNFTGSGVDGTQGISGQNGVVTLTTSGLNGIATYQNSTGLNIIRFFGSGTYDGIKYLTRPDFSNPQTVTDVQYVEENRTAENTSYVSSGTTLTGDTVQGAIDELDVKVSNINENTNLTIENNTSDNLDIASDTGTNATLSGATATLSGLLTGTDKSKLDGIENNADVTDTDNVNAAGAVMESDYSPAHTVLVQQSGTGTPSTVSIGNNTILGRDTGGGADIEALTPTQVRTIINVEDGSTADQIASEVPVTPTGNLVSTDVQSALNELQGEIDVNTAKISADGSIDTHSDVDISTITPTTGDTLIWDGVNFIPNVISHSDLNNLNNDDHTQYLTETRHDNLPNDNPHSVTFTQAVTADGGTDITNIEAEQLTDGSNSDSLHIHSATGVTYDNTVSTLTGTTVQESIDELDVNVNRLLLNTVVKTSAYTGSTLEDVIITNSNVNLYAGSLQTRLLNIRNNGKKNITITPNGSETIEGLSAPKMRAGNSWTLAYDGTSNWYIV